MKILQLTKKFPYPLKDGESIAVTNLSQSLKALGCEITLLSMNTVKHYIPVDTLPDEFDHYDEIYTVDLDNRVKIGGAFMNLFSTESYHISRFYFEKFKSRLIELLEQNKYDIVQLETLYLAPYVNTIKAHSKAKIIMRSHNVEYEIWERIASNTNFWPKRWYINHLTKKLKRFEINSLHLYDGLATVTQRDLDAYKSLGYSGKGISLPIGINMRDYTPAPLSEKKLSLSFIGSLDWLPNLEGLEWFLDMVWPELINMYPSLKLHIAGRNTPKSIKMLENDHIVIEGEVEDAKAFINRHTVMIVPLLSGSGMRVKILEGLALGRVVISTSIGMEGIHAEGDKEILIADTLQEFLEKFEMIIHNRSLQNEIAQNGRNFIEKNFDRSVNAQRFYSFLQSYL